MRLSQQRQPHSFCQTATAMPRLYTLYRIHPSQPRKRLDIHIGIPAFENISYPLHKSSSQGSINDPMIIGV